MVGTASDDAVISDDKVTISFNAKKYISEDQNNPIQFELYHFPDENHLLPISSKVSQGSTLYITSHLSIIEDLYLIRLTQVNYISQNYSPSHSGRSGTGYAWDKD